LDFGIDETGSTRQHPSAGTGSNGENGRSCPREKATTRIGRLDRAALEVAGRALLDVVVGRIVNGPLAACERDQVLTRRAADAIGIRISTSEQFVELSGVGELGRSFALVAGHR
jgi:hypothetical protein